MGVSDELSAWLPYLIDDIYGNFSSDDEAKQVDSDTELTAVESGGGEAPRSRELVSERTTARREYSLVPYSTAIQRRKKAELHALRLEVQYLTTKLARFRQAPSEAQPVNRITKSRADHIELREWQNRATAECEKRIQAEHSNQKLKAILRRQFKVFQSVRKRLRQIDTHEELEFLKQLPIVDWPVFQPDFSDFILSELSSNLGHLRPQADFILPAPSPNISVTFHTQTGYIVGSGHCFEMTSITPLACTACEAGDLLWRFISSKDNNAAETVFSFARARIPQHADQYDISCIASLLMQDTSQVPLYVDAVSAFRKYKENDRAVIVGSMMWLLPIEGLEFEGKYWSVMDPSPSDPSQASVIRFCYKLQVKNGGTKSASRIQQVMNSIGNQVRLYLQLQQDAFLSAASPIKGC